MNKNINRLLLEMKACNLRFIKGYSQIEIAKALNCSRATISRLLKDAIKDGIIEVQIKNPLEKVIELENLLKEKYHLKEVVVIRGKYKNSQMLKKAIGVAAAELASNLIKKNDIVGISCGRTIFEMVNALSQFQKELNIKTIPLLGGLGKGEIEFQINELCRLFAENFTGITKILDVPVIISNRDMRDMLLKEKGVQDVVKYWDKLDIAFISIGPPASSSLTITTKYFISESTKKLIMSKAVGDICARFFDKDGNECEEEFEYNLISIDFEKLKKASYRVGIAGGKDKIAGIKAVLSNRIINVLVTDEETARDILK